MVTFMLYHGKTSQRQRHSAWMTAQGAHSGALQILSVSRTVHNGTAQMKHSNMVVNAYACIIHDTYVIIPV